MSEQLILTAPVSGSVVALENVPDPVFSQRIVGDGLSIDPIGTCLVAPCSGSILQIHPSCHAIVVKSEQGPEILMHVGLETVSLKGQGFTPLVAIGDKVKAGEPLLEFDADHIALTSKSLLTEVLVTNGDLVKNLEVHPGVVEAGKTPVLTITLRDNFSEPQEAKVSSSESIVTSPEITIRNEQGIHARPAATLVNCAKRFNANVEMMFGDKRANCKSVVALLSLQIAYGDKVVIRASGKERDTALNALVKCVRQGMGEEIGPSMDPAKQAHIAKIDAAIAAQVAPPASDLPKGVFKGVPASPGLAMGRLFRLRRREIEVAEHSGNPSHERQLLDRMIGQAQHELEALEKNLRDQADGNKAAIFSAHRELLNDPDLVEKAHASIVMGISAAYAWKQAYTEQAQMLSQLNNELMAARATDVRDVGERVLRLLTGEEPSLPKMPDHTILVAEDLTPSDTATLDRSKVLGFATVLGGATSHASILARSLDLPAVAGVSPQLMEMEDGTLILLDGSKGIVDTTLTDAEMGKMQERLDAQAELKRKHKEHAHEPAITSDGHRVEVVANIGSLADAKQGLEEGGEGVGLLRSEFLFMGRTTPPSEEEQTCVYSDIAKVIGPDRPLIIRTLDVGGDKPLPYLPIPKEDNPFLGERGLRVGLNRPELLRTQIRAILKASHLAKVKVMLPMVTSIEEFREAKAIFAHEVNVLNIKHNVPLGVMIEIPAAAVMADVLAKEADFFSIGTNDLTQYTMAIDRGHPKLAAKADGLCPGVLRLIQMTVAGGHKSQRMVGVCGGIGGELPAVPILVGLGVDELSVAAPAIPAVKYTIRNLSYEQCRALAEKALGCENAARVRELVEAQQQ